MRGLTSEACSSLLDRAVEIGLLASHGSASYSIHPALPWFFQELFGHASAESQLAARRAFVEVVGRLGDFCHDSYGKGERAALSWLREEEANLLQTRRLALEHGWWGGVISAMQGLRVLYEYTGRGADWKRLVEEVMPSFVRPGTEAPWPGKEEEWRLVIGYRVRLAREERNFPEAKRLQLLTIAWNRRHTDEFLAQTKEGLDSEQKKQIRSLAVSLNEFGQIQLETESAECVGAFKESLELCERIADNPGVASCAFNLANAYKDLPEVRDLAAAEHWYQQSLKFHESGDRQGRAECVNQLGTLALNRFRDARTAGRSDKELLVFLEDAVRWYYQALELLPGDAIENLAITHNQLGNTYREAGDFDSALPHYQKAIRYFEAQGNLFLAAHARLNSAGSLASVGRLLDALAYAEEALRGYRTYGDRAAKHVAMTRELIKAIQEEMQGR